MYVDNVHVEVLKKLLLVYNHQKSSVQSHLYIHVVLLISKSLLLNLLYLHFQKYFLIKFVQFQMYYLTIYLMLLQLVIQKKDAMIKVIL